MRILNILNIPTDSKYSILRNPDWKNVTFAVREASDSRHSEGPIEWPP